MSYAIKRSTGEHLGFLLMAGGETSGDCLFRILPRNATDFDAQDTEHLHALQELGEIQWERLNGDVVFRDVNRNVVAKIVGEEMRSDKFTFSVSPPPKDKRRKSD